MLRRIAAGLVLCLGLGVLALVDSPFLRHASVKNSTVCSAQQFAHLPRRLDVVVLGSSRMRRGVDAGEMVAASRGQFSAVYNLGRPGQEILRSALILDELSASGQAPKVLVLEANIDALRLGRAMPWTWPRDVAGFTPWRSILLGTPSAGRYPDFRLVLDGLRAKLQQSLLLIANGVAWRVLTEHDVRDWTVCWSDQFDLETPRKANLRAAAMARVSGRRVDLETAFDRRFHSPVGDLARVELQTLERVRVRARQTGVHVIVVCPQGYGDAPYSREVLASLRALIPEFRYPPESLARRLSTLQIDGTHFGPEGRALYTRWVTETILADMQAKQAR